MKIQHGLEDGDSSIAGLREMVFANASASATDLDFEIPFQRNWALEQLRGNVRILGLSIVFVGLCLAIWSRTGQGPGNVVSKWH